jgi:hypothetical protein
MAVPTRFRRPAPEIAQRVRQTSRPLHAMRELLVVAVSVPPSSTIGP